MNIESLVYKIDLFQKIVITSGFRRDIEDNIQSIQHGQNQNLAYMKDLSNKIKSQFNEFENYSLQLLLLLVNYSNLHSQPEREPNARLENLHMPSFCAPA